MKIRRHYAILTIFAFTLALTIGCQHTPKKPAQETTAPAITPKTAPPSPSATLKVTPDTVDKGQTAELSWSTSNAATISIDGIGAVSATGSKTITPSSSTTYHLTATGEGGSTDASARITVNIPTAVVTNPTDEELFAQYVKDIFFSYDNFDIRQEEMQTVTRDAEFLAQHPNIKLVIEGHCDERGSEAYNLGLGENRAATIKNTLVQHGVGADRIKVISYGKEKPFCSSAENESCWQQNRRAHFALAN